MNENPLVTVLIPVYNRPSVINTINSILTQSYRNLEILVIDNASTDNTVEVIKSLRDERIRLIVNENNLGQTGSMNRGLQLAKGKYIARIDSDDIATPDRIELQVKFLESNEDYVLVGSWIQYISDDDVLGGVVKTCTTDEGLRFMQTFFCGIHHPTAMYRTDIIRDNGIEYDPNISMAEDYDMWRKLLKYGKGLNIAKVLVYYRRGCNNDSIKHLKEMIQETRLVRRKVCSDLVLSDNMKKRLEKALSIAEKDRQTLIEAISYFSFMLSFFKKSIKRESPDYPILHKYIYQMSYGTCIQNSNALWALPLQLLYNSLRKKMH